VRHHGVRWAVCLCATALAGCSEQGGGAAQSAIGRPALTPGATEDVGGAAEDLHAGHDVHAGHQAPGGHVHAGNLLPPTTPLPGLSVFQLTSRWTDQDGRELRLSSLRGRPTVVVMFYGTCRSVCPTLLNDAKRIDGSMPYDARAQMQYLLVTIDPATDTTERLEALAREHHFDTARAHLVRGGDEAVRELANALGVQYRKVREGEYAHSAVISLLDRDGVLAYQMVGLAQPLEEILSHVAQMLH